MLDPDEYVKLAALCEQLKQDLIEKDDDLNIANKELAEKASQVTDLEYENKNLRQFIENIQEHVDNIEISASDATSFMKKMISQLGL